MDWIRAISKLTGRCHESRKLCNHTYVQRRNCCGNNDCAAIRLHETDVITFHSDKSIDLNDGGWNTVTTKDRINSYFAGRVWTESGYWFTSYNGETVAGLGCVDSSDKLIGDNPAQQRAEIREAKNEANRPRNRARYWIAKSRGFSVDSSNCRFKETRCKYELDANGNGAYRFCDTASRWNRRTLAQHIGETFPCGCKVVNKPPVFRGTVADILAEENATVRLAKMRCYGMERFFLDANPEVIDSRAGYELIALPMDNRTQWITNRQNLMYALKMSCTTTGAVYINTVPDHCHDVPSALDWMFDTKDYLGTIGQQA